MTTRLMVRLLEAREVPTWFYWVGDESDNANNYENYSDQVGNEMTRMPTTGDDIILTTGMQRTMRIYPGNRVDCDFLIMSNVPAVYVPADGFGGQYEWPTLIVGGALEVHGAFLGRSRIDGGKIQIPAGGRLDFSGGRVEWNHYYLNMHPKYTEIYGPSTGDVYFSNGVTANLNPASVTAQSAATFYVGINSAGQFSPATANVSAFIQFRRDAGLWNASTGTINLNAGTQLDRGGGGGEG
ncbi:MAG TPA: hypothetical protein VKD90_04910, partial [Gemmataceae bacterium]|nr:hypothetical protein [Gemmataceae bacterium]